MFDLNELPDNEGPAGKGSASLYSFAAAAEGRGGRRRAAAKKAEQRDEDDDVVIDVGRRVVEDEEEEDEEDQEDDDEEDVEEERQQVYFRSGNSTKIVSRLLRDEEAEQGFLRLDNTPAICYSNDWKPLPLTTYGENDEIDTDNEVTVAALDARAILDSQVVSRLDSAVSLVVSTEPSGATFGISPRPEKLGQRTESSSRKYHPDFTNLHRSHPKWESVLAEKSDKLDDELNLASRSSLLYPGLVSSRKGKRARQEGNVAVDTILKLKRHARLTPAVVVADAYDGAGPSLSISLDQGAPAAAKTSSLSTAPHKISSKGEGSERREGIPLSFGESPLAGFESTMAVVQHALGHKYLASKSNLGLSLSVSAKVQTTGDKVESNLADSVTSVGDDREGHESSATGLKRIEREVVVEDAAGRVQQPSVKPVWQGKLVVHGYSATDVAAYCSADLQPASKLWSLPQVLTVENLVKIQEFFGAAKQANVVEPVMRLRLLPDAAGSGPSFSSMVTILNSKMKGRAKDRSSLPEMLGCVPASAAGSDYVFTASPKLKQPEEVANRTSTKLYLVLGSSLELVSTFDRELGNQLFKGVEGSCIPDENHLFGFLCVSGQEGRLDDSSKSREAKAESSVMDISTTKEQVVVHGSPSNKTEVVTDSAVNNNGPERMDAVKANMTCEGEGAVPSAERDEERAVIDGILPNATRDQKGHSFDTNHEKVRGKKENHNLRHNQSPTRDDARKDRERQRDRDPRCREKEKDLNNSSKDVHRYSQHRSSDKADPSKRDGSKDREGDRFRERSYRDPYRDLTDRSKISRERIKEHEKPKERQRDREKEKEKERPFKKRDRSPEPEMGTTDDVKCDLESEKTTSSAKQEEESCHQLLEQSVKENRKRIRVDGEETHENNLTTSHISTVQSETVDTKLAMVALDATTEPVTPVLLQDLRQAEGSGQVESSVQVTNPATAESLGDPEADAPSGKAMKNEEAVQVDHKDHIEKTDEVLPGPEEQIPIPSSSTNALPHNGADGASAPTIVAGNLNSGVAEGYDTSRVIDRGATVVNEETEEKGLVDSGESGIVKDKKGTSQSEEHAIEVLSKDMRDLDKAKSGGQSMNDANVKIYDKAGDTGGIEPSVPEPSYNPKEERTSDTEILDDVQPSKPNTLSVGVDDNCYPPGFEGPKSEDNEVSQDSGLLPRRFSKDNSRPSVQKSVAIGGDDQHGSLLGIESPSSATYNGLHGSSPALSAEVSSDTLLEGCDKETRNWLVSKQNASYLAEEFGVRIARVEEVVQAKSEAQQGPFDLKVFLVTEKSTDASEGKWFTNQAADMLQSLASRGVFAKCLWYRGHVQRYASDQGPSIQAIVRRIKGEDGKNLEKIQEETGIMIGIVLDANTRKGIGNSTRVIGLRIRGTRKKGIQEAIRQAEMLLSLVAEQFSKGSRARSYGSHDTTLSKLKVDFSNTSPSSGILTPMQKDVFAAYSPVSPVATISPLGSFKHKLDDSSIEVTNTGSATAPTSALPDSNLNGNPAPVSVAEFASQSQQSEDEQSDKGRRLSDMEAKYTRPLLVSNLPEGATTSMLRGLFEDVFKEKFGLPSSYEGVSDMIVDVRFSPDKLFAFVEFASDELLLEVLKIYADKKLAFFGLNLELGSSASLNQLERMFLAARTESTSKGLEYGGPIIDSVKLSKARIGRKAHKSGDHSLRVTSLRSSDVESDVEVSRDRRFGGRDGTGRYLREKPSPLFLTELMKNSSARSIHTLFEDIIKKYRNPSLGHFRGRAGVLDVRFIPSRGCAFVDLSHPELVDFMLDLHTRRPEVFHHMKMEIGRRPVPLGHGEEEPVVRRSSHNLSRDALVEESHSYGAGRRARGCFPSTSPPPTTRRNVLAVMDHDFVDDYEDEEEDERQPVSSRKRRSDPERTVYADRLPDNASEGMIRRIFERVLRENMTDEQREVLGDNIITEVRYVPTKFCAFIVLVAEELTRLVLQLYNQDEEIFKNMRLKPHFHSRMEDLYREDVHDREDAPVHRVLSRDVSTDRRSRRGMEEYQNGHYSSEIADLVHRGRNSAAHRAVAATAFKEVDRRRSVYVDRIPERLPEPKVRDLFERAMRQHRHGYRSHSVSQVTFFRDKFDPEKLCAFVELENEDMVQELLDIYLEDEEAFSGMRVRPAVKYGGH